MHEGVFRQLEVIAVSCTASLFRISPKLSDCSCMSSSYPMAASSATAEIVDIPTCCQQQISPDHQVVKDPPRNHATGHTQRRAERSDTRMSAWWADVAAFDLAWRPTSCTVPALTHCDFGRVQQQKSRESVNRHVPSPDIFSPPHIASVSSL